MVSDVVRNVANNVEIKLYYLKARQAQATDMLKARGHLFLNEVYDMLSFPRTKSAMSSVMSPTTLKSRI